MLADDSIMVTLSTCHPCCNFFFKWAPWNNLVKGTMFAKSPLASHNFLKIVVQETLLKTFSTSTCIMAQSGCRSRMAQMLKRMASHPPGVDTPNWWGDKCSWNGLQSCRIMEWLISQRNTLPTIIIWRPPLSFAIANNLLTLSIRAIDLRISPRAIIIIAWNNFENLEDASSDMNHPKKCSYTIPESPPENKWGAVAKAWANIILFKTKVCSSL